MGKGYEKFKRYRRILLTIAYFIVVLLLYFSENIEDRGNIHQATNLFYFTIVIAYVFWILFQLHKQQKEKDKAFFIKAFIFMLINIAILMAIDKFIKPSSIFDKEVVTMFLYFLFTFITDKEA